MATATIGKFQEQVGFKKFEGKGKVEDLGEDWQADAARAEVAEAARTREVAQQRESGAFYPGEFSPAADPAATFKPKGASEEPDFIELMRRMEAEQQNPRSAEQEEMFERKHAKKAQKQTQKERRREGAQKMAAEAAIRSANLKADWEAQQAMERALQHKAPSAATSIKDRRVEKALAVASQPSPQQAPAATPVLILTQRTETDLNLV
jgi:hypothetical protein